MLYAIKVGTGDGAGQQIVEADSPGHALAILEKSWADYDIRNTGDVVVAVAPASAVNFTPAQDADFDSPHVGAPGWIVLLDRGYAARRDEDMNDVAWFPTEAAANEWIHNHPKAKAPYPAPLAPYTEADAIAYGLIPPGVADGAWNAVTAARREEAAQGGDVSYKVGDIIEIDMAGGVSRHVKVDGRGEVEGVPSFEGKVVQGHGVGTSVWGYDRQIVRLVNELTH